MKRAWVLAALAAAGCATQIAPGDGGGQDAGSADVVHADSVVVDIVDVRTPLEAGADVHDAREDIPINRDAMEAGSDVTDVSTDDGNADTGFDAADVACPPSAPVRCGGVCVGDTQSNPARCGDSCTVCEVPVDGAASCESGSCGITCDPGFLAQSGQCVDFPAPRLVHPMTNSRVSVRNPTLRWAPVAGAGAVHVSICADRACTSVETEFDANGDNARVPVDLPHGVWYWRAQSIDRGVRSSALGATWQLRTPVQSSAVEWASPGRPDLNGDGLDDIAIGGDGLMLLPGNADATNAGVQFLDPAAPDMATFFQPAAVGDVDGDGLSDIGVFFSFTNTNTGLAWFAGSATDVGPMPVQLLGSPMGTENVVTQDRDQSGDFDRDGYSDLFVSIYQIGASDSSYSVLRGGPSGWTRSSDVGSGNALNVASATVGDFDADGYDDLLGVAEASHSILWWRGSPTGLQPAQTIGTFPAPNFAKIVSTGDTDGDGYPDAVFNFQDESDPENGSLVTLIRGGPAGPVFGTTSACARYYTALVGVTADVNGDGQIDLAFDSDTVPELSFCVSNGSGFVRTGAPTTPLGSSCNRFFTTTQLLGDWNGDGIDDFAAICGGDVLYLFLGPYVPGAAPLVVPLPSDGTRHFYRFMAQRCRRQNPLMLRSA